MNLDNIIGSTAVLWITTLLIGKAKCGTVSPCVPGPCIAAIEEAGIQLGGPNCEAAQQKFLECIPNNARADSGSSPSTGTIGTYSTPEPCKKCGNAIDKCLRPNGPVHQILQECFD